MFRLAWLILLLGGPAAADIIVAARTIRPQSVIARSDLAIQPGEAAGTTGSPADLIGKEARVAIYAGRPVRPSDVGPPAVIERNQIVPILFKRGGLSITTEGRALDRAGVGEVVRVMNLSSRTTVSGHVLKDGRVEVSK